MVLAVISLYLLGDIFQLPFLREGFHADPTILALLLGAFGMLIGVEILAHLPGISPRPGDRPGKTDADE